MSADLSTASPCDLAARYRLPPSDPRFLSLPSTRESELRLSGRCAPRAPWSVGGTSRVRGPESLGPEARQLSEALLQEAAARAGIAADPERNQLALIRTLEDEGLLGAELADVFHAIRKSGNAAAHRFTGTPADGMAVLRLARAAGIWFYQTFHDATFRPGPFSPPQPAPDAAAELFHISASLHLPHATSHRLLPSPRPRYFGDAFRATGGAARASSALRRQPGCQEQHGVRGRRHARVRHRLGLPVRATDSHLARRGRGDGGERERDRGERANGACLRHIAQASHRDRCRDGEDDLGSAV